MSQQIAQETVAEDAAQHVEYSVTIDGVIEVPENVDETEFFDGLLDVLIGYVEKHKGQAGLSMSHQELARDCCTKLQKPLKQQVSCS